MERFTWEEGSVVEYQDGLRSIFANQPELKHKFSAFLDAPIHSEAERAAAKAQLCDIVGIMPQRRDPNRPTMNDNKALFSEIEVYIFVLVYIYHNFLVNGTILETL